MVLREGRSRRAIPHITMKSYMLIYDAFEDAHYGVFDKANGERLAGIIVTPTPTGDTFEGSINGRRKHAREWESLDEFAERLYRLATPPPVAPTEERLSLGLFA